MTFRRREAWACCRVAYTVYHDNDLRRSAQCVAIVSPPQCCRIPCSMCVTCEVKQMANSCGHPAIGHDKDRVTQSKHFRCCLPWLDVVAVLAPVRVGCFLVGDEVLQRRRALSERQGVCVFC